MTDTSLHAANKVAVSQGLRDILIAPASDLDAAVAAVYSNEAELSAFHPVNEAQGARAIADALWRPIRESFPDIERREQIVAAGEFQSNDYVCSLSFLQGTFAKDWLGIPANHGVVTLKCGEMSQVANGKILRSFVLIDTLDLMFQAGCWPLSPSLGAESAWLSPATHDGAKLDTVDSDRGAAALKLVKDMHGGLLAFDGKDLSSMHHAQYWTPSFNWFGPSGVGTARGLAGFEAHHQVPFLRAFPDRNVARHIANVGDGDYVVTGGWPSVVATHSGPDWLNLGPTGKQVGMRVMDFYRVDGELIAENWVPIDIVDILRQLDVDVFRRLAQLGGKPRRGL